MAKLSLDYYKGEDQYSDGEVEEEILALVREGKAFRDIPEEKCTFPVLYHLSPVRENILRWYPFERKSDLLEIGAGCGALTGMLCEKAGSVTSVELSKRRSRINFLRNENRENLEIIVGNYQDIEFTKKFDYIILNGVFEYAAGFTRGEKPYEAFLEDMKALLSENGVLLIAIENRIGLKYFAGAPEDHTDAFGLGINGYPYNDSVRTFSQEEWKELIAACGFEHYRFYYPYPDYKMPNEIFTDETLERNGYGRDYYAFSDRLLLFHESYVAETFAKEQIMGRLANSFLVEIGKQPLKESDRVLYARLNSDRNERFQIATTIAYENGQKVVYKYALCEEAQEHLKNISRHEQRGKDGPIRTLQGEKTAEGLRYPFLCMDNLHNRIGASIRSGQPEEVEALLQKLFEVSFAESIEKTDFQQDAFIGVFGKETLPVGSYPCVKQVNIDLICDNIFEAEDGLVAIDCEWVFDFYIPTSFVIWRSLNELYGKHSRLEKLLPKERLMEKYQITEKMSEVFQAWNRHFTLAYVGANRLERYARRKTEISLDQVLLQKRRERMLCGSLYLDLGNGFSEENKIYQETELKEGKFQIDFVLPDAGTVKSVRFDPAEQKACRCRVFLKENGQRLYPANADAVGEDFDLFLGADPQYCFDIDGRSMCGVLTLQGELEYVGREEACVLHESGKRKQEEKQRELEERNKEYELQNAQLMKNMERLQSEKQCLEEQLNAIMHSKGWKYLEKYRNLRSKIMR